MSILGKRCLEMMECGVVASEHSPFDILPMEMLDILFGFVDDASLLNLRSVCKRFQTVILQSRFWRRRYPPHQAIPPPIFHDESMVHMILPYRRPPDLEQFLSYWRTERGKRRSDGAPRALHRWTYDDNCSTVYAIDINEKMAVTSAGRNRTITFHGRENQPRDSQLPRIAHRICLTPNDKVWEYALTEFSPTRHVFGFYDVEREYASPIHDFSCPRMRAKMELFRDDTVAICMNTVGIFSVDPRMSKMNLMVGGDFSDFSIEEDYMVSSHAGVVQVYDLRFCGGLAVPFGLGPRYRMEDYKCLIRDRQVVAWNNAYLMYLDDVRNANESYMEYSMPTFSFGGCLMDRNFLFFRTLTIPTTFSSRFMTFGFRLQTLNFNSGETFDTSFFEDAKHGHTQISAMKTCNHRLLYRKSDIPNRTATFALLDYGF